MSITFNAIEIFEMAEQIERNGVKFYTKAAGIIQDKDTRKFLLDLSAMEKEHEKTFADMRGRISPKERELVTFDPENEVTLYLQAMADGHVFDIKNDLSKKLSSSHSVRDILSMAIEAERDSIVFYLGLKDFVPSEAGKEKVEAIIKEERSHIITLSRKLKSLK